MSALALRFYSSLMWLGQPLLRRKLARRGIEEPGYLQAIEERFGHYSQVAEPDSELVWVHAVSLGETRTAGLLLKALRAQHPGLRILLTHGTATGRAEGAGLLRPGDVQVWQPWDNPASVDRFLQHFRPRLGLLMETEVWPNLVAGSSSRKVPLVLVNGRLSEKSLQQGLRMPALSRPAYRSLAAVYAQTDDDARRFREAGAQVAGVFGNLKFDASPDPAQQALGRQWRQATARPVVMFASSREGEEKDFFVAWARAVKAAENAQTPAPRMLIVPRHPQRFDEVASLAESQGLRVSRRSSWKAGPAQDGAAPDADVWLGDSLGEMALYYAMSDVALLGGSFAPLGGQNLIEAAACGCPVVMGPHTFNFSEAAELAEAAGAAFRTAGMATGVQTALRLAADRPGRDHASSHALSFAARNRGATERTLAALAPLLARLS